MNPDARSAISLFLVPLITAICFAAEAASDEDDGAAVKALDESRSSSLRPSDGYLVDWDVIGPFSAREENGIGFAVVDVGEFTEVNSVQHAERKYSWTSLIAMNDDAVVVDLSGKFGADAEGIAYAVAEVYVNRDMNATIRVETRDEVACWLNGEAITLAPKPKRSKRAYESSVRLRMGHNTVVMGLRHGKGKWSFSARVLDEAGELIDPKRLRILDDSSILREKQVLPVEIHRR